MSENCKKYYRNRKRKALENNTCYCGRGPRVSEIYCRICLLKKTSRACFGTDKRWAELDALLHKQRHRCAYSGRQIDIGKRASIEHIHPTSRSKNRRTSIENVKWVHSDINLMKSSMTLHEFMLACKEVLQYFGYEVRKGD